MAAACEGTVSLPEVGILRAPDAVVPGEMLQFKT